MQSAGAGAEGDVHALGIFRVGLRAVPQARAAVDAFLAVEGRHAGVAGSNRLAAACFDANPRAAFWLSYAFNGRSAGKSNFCLMPALAGR